MVVLVAGVGGGNGAAAARVGDGIRWGACDKTGAKSPAGSAISHLDGAAEGAVAQSGAADEQEKPGGRVECAMIRVPLNYAQPAGQQISLAVNRVRGSASRDGNHLGVLLVNPGGPGASGRDLAKYVAMALPKDVTRRYDIVGFDPRGVAASEPAIRCVDPKRYYKAPRPDNVPHSRGDETALLGRARGYARSCGNRWSWLLPHMTTANTARDMDAIRRALGENKISYLGYSYGTYLGAVYATMFPTRVRRLVLDSIVDPRGVWYGDNLSQDYAFDRRHRDFLRWVAQNDKIYRLGKTLSQTRFAWYSMRDRLHTRPAKGVVGPSEFDDIFTMAGYTDAIWPQLAQAFSAYARKGDTTPLQRAYKQYGTNGSVENENGYAVYLGVECRDAPWPRDWAKWHADSTAANSGAHFMAWPNAWYNAPCAFWPVRGGTPIRVGARGLPPALFIQARRDAATPYRGALRMRRLFPGARLLTVPGGNHGVSLNGNACVDSRLAAYLRDGTLPGRGGASATCRRTPAPLPAARLGSAFPGDRGMAMAVLGR
jgi:pimeloyl-ACP methyl ester carboxylesterase